MGQGWVNDVEAMSQGCVNDESMMSKLPHRLRVRVVMMPTVGSIKASQARPASTMPPTVVGCSWRYCSRKALSWNPISVCVSWFGGPPASGEGRGGAARLIENNRHKTRT